MILRWTIAVVTVVLAAVTCSPAQEAQRLVKFGFIVTDSNGRYVSGLKPSDFRVLEDGIPQKLSTFAEGTKPPLAVNDDGSTRPIDGKASETGGPEINLEIKSPDGDNFYTVTYLPHPNANEGFREIRVQIVGGRLRIRARPGYSPRGAPNPQ